MFWLSIIVQTDPLKIEIEELAESIFDIKSSQEYIVARERKHRDSKFTFIIFWITDWFFFLKKKKLLKVPITV